MSILLPKDFSPAEKDIVAKHTCLSGLEVLKVAEKTGVDIRRIQTTPPFSSPEPSQHSFEMEQLLRACMDGTSENCLMSSGQMLSREVQQTIFWRICSLFPEFAHRDVFPEKPSARDVQPWIPIFSGPATSGKSASSEVIAALCGYTIVDGDALHPQQNITIMSQGKSLDDTHRVEWMRRIARIARELQQQGLSVAITCSALSEKVRGMLREQLGEHLFYFHHYCSLETMRKRAASREHPFIPRANNDVFLNAQSSADQTLRGAMQGSSKNTLWLNTDYHRKQDVLRMILEKMNGWGNN
jgi:carbohydrate kinase (thermoresistant glucokinase family)